MNAQLLLLLALVGPFCAFTHASPTSLPEDTLTTEKEPDVTAGVTSATHLDHTIVTGPPATEPAVAHADEITQGVTEAAPLTTMVHAEEPETQTDAPDAPATAAPEPAITDAPVVATAAPIEPTEAEVQTEGATAAGTESSEELVIEDGGEEGLSSGQVVGIVIGALLAVVIVIAVVIAAVRRMGKYSSAKNKKPAKKDGVVSPLRKRSGKQQERPRFWKF